jgi:hypothetical protein
MSCSLFFFSWKVEILVLWNEMDGILMLCHAQIGKTSGLVMTLCGVLKNILLVIASVAIWGTIITWLQVLGYGIATAGLVYYGVGYEGVMTYYEVTRAYAGKLWEGEVDTSTSTGGRGGRKWILVGMYTVIVMLLVIGVGLQTGRGKEMYSDLTERSRYP